MIASRMMQCSIKEEVKIRRQEIVEEIKCFRCWGVGHYKWECPNTKVKRKKRREEEVVCMAKPQKMHIMRQLLERKIFLVHSST